MAGDSSVWLLLAGVLLSRWLLAWAQTPSRLWLFLGLCLFSLLWLSAPSLASFGRSELEYWLSHYGRVIAVYLCIEAWLVGTLFARYGWLSPASWAALFHLQALLFQSGYLDASFDNQSLMFAGTLIAAGVLLHFGLARRLNLSNAGRTHFPLIWFCTWLGFNSWPDNTGIQGAMHLRDTIVLLASIPLATLCSLFFSLCWARLSGPLRGL